MVTSTLSTVLKSMSPASTVTSRVGAVACTLMAGTVVVVHSLAGWGPRSSKAMVVR